MSDRERRMTPGPTSVRAETRDDGTRMLTGYAAVFNSRTEIKGWFSSFTEEIAPGAFVRAISEDDVRALFNHDSSQVLGRSTSGTLRLSEDKKGLRFEIDLPDTQAGRDIATLVSREDITGNSFAFDVIGEEWEDKDKDVPHRRLTELRLYDVGPVTYPAYSETSIEVSKRTAETVDQIRKKGDAVVATHVRDSCERLQAEAERCLVLLRAPNGAAEEEAS